MARIGPARFGALLLARVLLGLSAGLYTVSVPALIAEGLPSRKAEAYLATYPCGWPTGALLAILMASNHWRLALGLGPLIASMLLAAAAIMASGITAVAWSQGAYKYMG